VILAVVIINAGIGFFQEYKAEKVIDALKSIIIAFAKVYRQNKLNKIEARMLVPGDIISLEEGDKVPADARLLELKNFRTQESSLTGESTPVTKRPNPLKESTPLADQKNMVFTGTIVVSGEARAVVVSIGDRTEIGKIAYSIQHVKTKKSHFKEKTDQLALIMGSLAFIGSIFVFLIGYFINGLDFVTIFFFTIAALVSGIPEGLPAIMTVVLAVGSWRMAKRNAIIRKLPSVETFSIVNVIVTDKTGTLTNNALNVEKITTNDSIFNISGTGWQPIGKFYKTKKQLINPLKIQVLEKLSKISSICNRGELLRKEGNYEIIGDPTEVALLVLSQKAGIVREELKKKEKILDEIPFTSELKYRAMLIEIKEKKQKQIYAIGAFEKLIDRSEKYFDNGEIKKLDDKMKKELQDKALKMARDGLRVLAITYKHTSHHIKNISDNQVKELIFVGLAGMKDSPRKEVKNAIKKAKQAGIRVIMNTGDHKETAVAVAKEIGLVSGKKINVLTGEQMEKISEQDLDEAVKKINIFARVTPKMKLKIVSSLQKQGYVVAMTGDGVNDAPALKKSDVGIAMGIIGTDVAREAGEVILADDNFSSIVNAVEEGRIVFRNMRQASTYLVSTNTGEHVTLIIALLMKLPLPLLPIHILWMNLVTDGFNGIALAMEKGHGTALDQLPLKKEAPILNKEALPFLLVVASSMVLITIPVFIYFFNNFGIEKAMTSAFLAMSFCQIFNVLNMRSLHKSIFKIGLFSNKYVIMSLVTSIIGILSVVYIPVLQNIFRFSPLSFGELALIILASSLVLISGEVYKKMVHRK